ncbi:Mob1/phocein [Coniochaeta sp. 2T2.1]|nr:Mob1/phocein [Coniochaeta sp. 2T2.1]
MADGNTTSNGSGPSGDEVLASYHLPTPKPLWLNAAYARHIVRGNFMTLSARPKTVEMGEWVAHQVVEHWRMLVTFIKLVHDKDEDGYTICNGRTCPKMSAGPNHSFTWLNSRLEPVEIPAYEYLSLVQRYISSKIDDSAVFPTDPSGISFAPIPPSISAPVSSSSLPSHLPSSNSNSNPNLFSSQGQGKGHQEGDWTGSRSGFPPHFLDVCQKIFRQMFRVYAHLYWSHFEDPMYHLGLEKSMNSCFSHFILTATTLDLLGRGDLEPMQALVDLWAANGTFPKESRAYGYANLRAGERLLELAGASTAI